MPLSHHHHPPRGGRSAVVDEAVEVQARGHWLVGAKPAPSWRTSRDAQPSAQALCA